MPINFSHDLADTELADFHADMNEMRAEWEAEWIESMEQDAGLSDYDLEGAVIPLAQTDADF